MRAQPHLADLADAHLKVDLSFLADIMELQRSGATTRYSGPTPRGFRVSGPPNIHNEQDFISRKLWRYVEREKMFVPPVLRR